MAVDIGGAGLVAVARYGRKLRIQYPGAVYHVMNRGDRRESIFQDEADRLRFMETSGEARAKTDGQVHALCLDGESFPSGGQDAESESGRGDEVVSWHLDGTVQSAAQALWAPVLRALQCVGGGRDVAGPFPGGVRVCAFESGAGEVAGPGTIAAGLRLELLPGASEAAGTALALARGSDGAFYALDACCGPNVTITVLSTVTNGVHPQVITRTWQATDCCGNNSTCSQTVTVP